MNPDTDNRQARPPEMLTIPARDGYPLSAARFRPHDDDSETNGVAVFCAATGTPQTLYYRCARYFAERGMTAYAWDYRGIGRSAPAVLRGFDASVATLAERDIPAVLDFVHQAHPSADLNYIGHSVGGQLMGMAENASLITRAVFCSSQNGYWKLQGRHQKYAVWLAAHVVLPGLTRLVGYFPWKRLSGGENLPAPMALQWAKWCRSPNYLFDDDSLPHRERYAQFRAPILAWCFTDDDWGTPAAVHSLMSHYRNADVCYREVAPADVGRQKIGHFGYFRRGSEPLWDETLQWLQTPSGLSHSENSPPVTES